MTKIPVIVDSLGNPLAPSLTGGNVHDVIQSNRWRRMPSSKALLDDEGSDTDGFIASLQVRGIKPVIAPKSTRKVKRA